MTDYIGTPRIVYGEDDEFLCVRACPKCGRLVKADETSNRDENTPNATCAKCGRVRMPTEYV